MHNFDSEVGTNSIAIEFSFLISFMSVSFLMKITLIFYMQPMKRYSFRKVQNNYFYWVVFGNLVLYIFESSHLQINQHFQLRELKVWILSTALDYKGFWIWTSSSFPIFQSIFFPWFVFLPLIVWTEHLFFTLIGPLEVFYFPIYILFPVLFVWLLFSCH